MPESAIVVGAGIFGTSIADALAARGWSVQLIDRQGPGNDVQASAGLTRLFRFSHGDDEWFTRLAWSSQDHWARLEEDMDVRLLERTGLLWLLTGEAEWERASLRRLESVGIPAQLITVDDVGALLPSASGDDLVGGLYEPQSGVLRASKAVRTLSQRAQRHGCELFVATAEPHDDGLMVDGVFRNADLVVWACGAWLSNLFPDLLSLRVTKQDTLYLDAPPSWSAEGVPAWIDFGASAYGTPDIAGFGAKVGSDLEDELFEPDRDERSLTPHKTELVRTHLRRRFPDLADAAVKLWRVCQYASTPDEHWIIAPRPDHPHHWIVGGGSGHGFKHGPAFGSYATDTLTGEIPVDERFALGERTGGAALRTQRDSSVPTGD